MPAAAASLRNETGFDVVGIQPGHFADYAVDQHDRVVRLVDRRSAADQEFGVCARCRIGRSDPHAGDASLQGVADRIDGDTLQEMPSNLLMAAVTVLRDCVPYPTTTTSSSTASYSSSTTSMADLVPMRSSRSA